MSKAAFGNFMAKVAQDAELRRELEALAEGPRGIPASALVALAARQGFSFGVEDVVTELGEEELAGVAGGLLPAVNVAHKVFPKVETYFKFDAALKVIAPMYYK